MQIPRHRPRPAFRRPFALRRPFATVLAVLVAGAALLVTVFVMTPAETATPAIPRAGEHGAHDGQPARSDGVLDDDTISPFDETHPALVNLDPALLAAVREAATDAAADGVDMWLTSGWRSAAYQRHLLEEAIARYGSEAEARKWVNTPERSTHVTGAAVDVGPTDGYSWLSQHGARYGLCQIYANEMWHFELAVEPGGQCPATVEDARVG